MPDVKAILLQATRLLNPKGRAFRMPEGGVFERLHKALIRSENRAYNDALSILDSTIADNPQFSVQDATEWEARLGIIGGGGSPLATRMAAINQKLNFPGTPAPRQHYSFIEAELQAAGFNVKIYENNFAGVTKTPAQILGSSGATLHSATTRHRNTTRHGGQFNNKVANYIEESKDATFVIGSNYRSTFYVAGATVTTFANVPAARKAEFRQLILQLKPLQTVGYLFVNYV